ncbi:MAG: hypothetical protein K6G13_04620, partial [Agathobacter sp.]|uniref:hypothetical protein n=1 Tax=Agathobacter sp. TaxID=2021311 RepID=UPI0025870646
VHKPGTPFTLQEYFGFHICKSSHPDYHKTFFKIVQAFKRHMVIRMRAFAYMKTKIFLQSEGLSGFMG